MNAPKYAVGDRVAVWFPVVGIDPNDGFRRVKVRVCGVDYWPGEDLIAQHQPAPPKPLAAGETVRTAGRFLVKILHIEDETAFIKYDSGACGCLPTSSLARQ